VQHIDVNPNARVTRRQSREREEREKERERAEAMKTSTSTSALPTTTTATTTATAITTTVEESVKEKDSTAEIKACASAVDSKAAVKAAAKPKKAAPKPKAKPKKTTTKVKIEPVVEPTVSTKESTAGAASTSASSSVEAAPTSAPVTKAVVVKKPVQTMSARRRVKRSDPSQCLEIIAPMYNLFYQQEDDYLVKPYMAAQKDINNRMRGILVDWLVEVHYKFRLQSPTLWLCINLLDRYLEKKTLLRNKLQLLGVTCLFVACKFEEIYPPEVRDCVYITDNAYNRDEVLAMEQSVLSVLDYKLCVPTGYHFLTRYLNIINANEKTRFLAFYYAERNLQESLSFNHKPSELVSAALYAALQHEVQENCRYDSDNDDDDYPHAVWPDILIEETGFDESDLLQLARSMMKHVGEEPVTTSMRHLIAAKKKYLNDKYFNVAELSLPTI
jgi:hypothetical protein